MFDFVMISKLFKVISGTEVKFFLKSEKKHIKLKRLSFRIYALWLVVVCFYIKVLFTKAFKYNFGFI